MADNMQPTGFSLGVKTPKVIGLDQVAFNNGFESKSADFTLTYGGGGAGEIAYSLGSSQIIQGVYTVRLSIAGVAASLVLSATAKAGVASTDAGNIVVLSHASDDTSILKFKKAEFVTTITGGVTSIHLVVYYKVDSTSTIVSASIGAYGNNIVLNPINYGSLTSPAAFLHRYMVVNDVMRIQNFRDGTSPVNIDLNTQRTPGSLSCNPANLGSRPDGTTGFGSCLIFGSSVGPNLSQFFTAANGACFTRHSEDSGANWSAWGTFGDSSSLLAKADRSISIATGTSLNTAVLSGFYDFTATPTDGPAGLTGAGNLLITASGANSTQLAFNGAGRVWTRTGTKAGAVWTFGSWTQIAAYDEKVDKTNTMATINFNTLLTTGFYHPGTSSTNGPATGGTGKDMVIVSSMDNAVTQILINTVNGRMWSRAGIITSGVATFASWVKVVAQDELDAALVATSTLKGLYRGSFRRETHNGVMDIGAHYSIFTGTNAIDMYLPLKVDTAVGDRIFITNLYFTWPASQFRVRRQETTTFIHGVDEDLICDRAVGGFTLVCSWKDLSGTFWVVV